MGSCGSPRAHPYTACTHHVDTSSTGPPLRCCPVGQTPIYDQLRGERINADVPATGADPQRVDHAGKHRLPAGAPVPTEVFGPPVSETDFAENPHHRVWTYPAGQSAGDAHRAAAVWGPRAALPPAAHERHAPPRAATRRSPAPANGPNPPARDTAAGGRSVHSEKTHLEKRCDCHREDCREAAPINPRWR